MENVRKHKDIKLFTPERRVNYLVSESNFHTTEFFTEKLLPIKIKIQNSKLPKGKNTKVIGLMKGALGGKIMTKLVVMIKMQKTQKSVS